MNIIERFEDRNIEGEYISLEISDAGHAYIGTRFEYRCRWLNAPLPQAIDFFRNYACLLSASEMKDGLVAYKKWKSGFLADARRDYFWNYFEGLRPQNCGRRWDVIKWVAA